MSGWSAGDIPDQAGRTVVVTGASSGLGLRSAEALAAKGAWVLLGCRDAGRGEAARERVAAVATGQPPEVVALDLADLASVRKAADELGGRVGRIDVLIDNAGVMAVPLGRTPDGFELQFGTNHLGHFALTGLLLPALLGAEAPRVVAVSSMAHRMGRIRWDDPNWQKGTYSRWLAYGQSKLANLMFIGELDRLAAAAGTSLTAAAAHPGYADTRLQTTVHDDAGHVWKARGMRLLNRVVAQPDTAGALPQLYAATMPDVVGGEYFGPSGPGEARGSPRRVGMTSAARDALSGQRLWRLSEQLTGVTYPWPTAPSG